MDSKLLQIFDEGGKGIEQLKKENLSWVCEDNVV